MHLYYFQDNHLQLFLFSKLAYASQTNMFTSTIHLFSLHYLEIVNSVLIRLKFTKNKIIANATIETTIIAVS